MATEAGDMATGGSRPVTMQREQSANREGLLRIFASCNEQYAKN